MKSPRVSVNWHLTQDKCMFQGPAGEVASFTDKFINSLSYLQLISNERNLSKHIAMYDKEATDTDVFSLPSQISTQSSPMQLKDASNVSLHQTHSDNLNFLNKKVLHIFKEPKFCVNGCSCPMQELFKGRYCQYKELHQCL